MFWRNKKKLQECFVVVENLNTALERAQRTAEKAVAALVETKALLDRSESNAERWRQLCESAQRPASDSVPDVKPVNGWVN